MIRSRAYRSCSWKKSSVSVGIWCQPRPVLASAVKESRLVAPISANLLPQRLSSPQLRAKLLLDAAVVVL
mgnify:FL=1